MAFLSLTWNEFLSEANSFLMVSKRLNDNWELVKINENVGNSFLKYKQKIQSPISLPRDESEEDYEFISLNNDDNLMVPSYDGKGEVLLMEYHILYSISYQVPMLYMSIQRCDGSSVELENVWEIISANDKTLKTKTREELLSILTQMEHPVLFKPFYAIHPCKTPELLGQTPDSRNIILTFISLMGTFVHLTLDNRYGIYFKD